MTVPVDNVAPASVPASPAVPVPVPLRMDSIPSSPNIATAGALPDTPFGGRQSSRVSRAFVGVAIAVAIAAAVLVSWYFTRKPAETTTATGSAKDAATPPKGEQPVMLTGEQARRIGVTYTTAVMSPLATEVRTVAQVNYDETRVRSIAPKLDGWIDQLYVNYTGQPVHAGDSLLAIYSPMIVAAQQELLLAVQLDKDVANTSTEAKRSSTDLRDAARRRLLYWDITPADVERIEQTGQVQKTVVLRAPVSGVVVEKNVLSGQKIMAGDALYKVADLSIVWVEGEVFERDFSTVHVGQTVQAEFQALPGVTHSGRITYIYPTFNPDTRTARVRVQMANGDLALKPGMYATIRIEGASSARVLNVPRSAVLSTGKRDLVFVQTDAGLLEPREVVVGVTNDTRVQILQGIRAGEKVVASATFLVDAESNLGSQLGGMGNMPGMSITPAAKPAIPKAKSPAVPMSMPKR